MNYIRKMFPISFAMSYERRCRNAKIKCINFLIWNVHIVIVVRQWQCGSARFSNFRHQGITLSNSSVSSAYFLKSFSDFDMYLLCMKSIKDYYILLKLYSDITLHIVLAISSYLYFKEEIYSVSILYSSCYLKIII